MQTIINFEQLNSLLTHYQEIKNIINNLNSQIAHVQNNNIRSLLIQLNLKFNSLEIKIQELKTIILTSLFNMNNK